MRTSSNEIRPIYEAIFLKYFGFVVAVADYPKIVIPKMPTASNNTTSNRY